MMSFQFRRIVGVVLLVVAGAMLIVSTRRPAPQAQVSLPPSTQKITTDPKTGAVTIEDTVYAVRSSGQGPIGRASAAMALPVAAVGLLLLFLRRPGEHVASEE